MFLYADFFGEKSTFLGCGSTRIAALENYREGLLSIMDDIGIVEVEVAVVSSHIEGVVW